MSKKKLKNLSSTLYGEFKEASLEIRVLENDLDMLEIEKHGLEAKVLNLENHNTMLKDQVLALEASSQKLIIKNEKLNNNSVKGKEKASEAKLNAENNFKRYL